MGNALASPSSLFDDSASDLESSAAKFVSLIGVRQRQLNVVVAGFGDLHGNRDRDLIAFNGCNQFFLTVFEKAENALDVIPAEAGLACDLGMAVTPFRQGPDILHEFQGTVPSASEIFDEAHQEALFPWYLDDDGWDLLLIKHLECFKATLTAYQIEFLLAVLAAARADRDGFLETDERNAVDDFVKLLFATISGIENLDLLDGDHLNGI